MFDAKYRHERGRHGVWREEPAAAAGIGPVPLVRPGGLFGVAAAGDRAPGTEDGSLIGREADLERLDAFLADIGRSGGSLALLGEPGVGKTALLAAFTRRAEAAGMRVLHTVGGQYRAQTGYGALRQLLAPIFDIRSRAADVPVLAAALDFERGVPPGQEAVAEAVVSLLVDLSRARSTVLVLDDSQWLDPASAVVLARVAHRLVGAGTGMVCAVRLGDESFFDHSGLPLHELGPLSEAASEELLIRRFPSLVARVRRRLMDDAEGNPLALLELPASLTDSQRSAAQALPRRIPLSLRLQSTFASRITMLPAATRHLLLVAALEGSGNLLVVRRAVAGRCSLKHLAPAERVRLVHVDDTTGRLGFGHSLIRSAVVDLSTSDQRRSVHRALAEAWTGAPEQRVWHLAQAAEEPDETIAALLEETAEAGARRGDGPNAVAALVRAADLSPAATEQARRLAKAAYVGANITGDLRDVPRLLEHARRADPGTDSPAATVAATMYLLNSHGDVDTAHRLLSGAIALQPEPCDLTDPTLLEALTTLLLVCAYGARPRLWADYDAALAKCTSVPDTLRLLRATFADPARARPCDWARLDAAVAALANVSDPVHIVRIGTAGAYADRLGAMEEPLLRTARGGTAGESNFPAIQASFLWGSHAWFTGRWRELRETVGDGLVLCDEFDYPLRSWTGKFVLACVSAACGDFPTARALADRMDQWGGSRRAHAVTCYAAHAKTILALSQGDFETAYHQACRISPAGTLAPFVGHTLWAILDTVEAAVRTGRHDKARNHVAAARAAGLDAVSPRLRIVVRASAAMASRNDAQALRWFGEAVTDEDAERWPFDHARIRLYYGERLCGSGAFAPARSHLTAAEEIFERLGATPWAHRAGRQLHACDGDHIADLREIGALTPQEHRIASLAATGLTNKEIGERLFLSPRTVSSHLYRAFPKLGVTSRAALRDALEGSRQ
ncbi:LuxR family transcriptional regulator [Streptomyces sp. SID3343]|uniref:helix-turn-helix transcriptional regulator n=1 Tax=Streptomyces sp. SID3343 TaxID=2690260 RepID=UPI00136BEC01|nr:LuxR family transcriptional regulator [Streptomyces sp. SID3343]